MSDYFEIHNVKRDTLLSITNRHRPLTNLIKKANSQLSFKDLNYIADYFLLRQLLDDLMDIKFDKEEGVSTFATKFGEEQTKTSLSFILNRMQRSHSKIAKKHHNILQLFKRFYFNRIFKS
ncbi:MAG: hypothetical protein QY312_03280 [Candidatus Dojkabacteria bacterium]|nr:MAG: hypothetical protein QY312_03280 [Candidatus Dojkabacteria bacterium]